MERMAVLCSLLLCRAHAAPVELAELIPHELAEQVGDWLSPVDGSAALSGWALPKYTVLRWWVRGSREVGSVSRAVPDNVEQALHRMQESVTGEDDCHVRDWLGNCHEPDERAPTFEDAEPSTPFIRLSEYCQVDWLSSWMSHQTSDWLRSRLHQVKGQTVEEIIESQMPGAKLDKQEIVVRAPTGTVMYLSNIQLVDVDPIYIEYGVCWDSYEWWKEQLLPVQLHHMHSPDGIQMTITSINAHISFDFRVEQHIGPLTIPMGSGSGSVHVRGLMTMEANLHTVTTAAVDRCEGKFESTDIHFSHTLLSSDLIMPLIRHYIPALDNRIAPTICYGNPDARGMAIGLKPKVSFGGQEETIEWRGLAPEINEMLRESADLLTVVGWGDTPPAERLQKALEDQQRLREVGVETELGQGRFVHVNGHLPPSPPNPPPFGLTSLAIGALNVARGGIELHRGALEDVNEISSTLAEAGGR